jgi:hypothetical protein
VEWEIMPQLYVGEIGATGPRWPTVAS